MRFLGIDYGVKRIGLAISDENHTLAFPKEIVLNNKDAFRKIGDILEKENITGIVIGESLNFLGNPNSVLEEIEIFISKLKQEFGIKIHKEKEFLTSVEARKIGNTKMNLHKTQAHSKIKKIRSDKVDAGAAALILQRFLDRYNKSKCAGKK